MTSGHYTMAKSPEIRPRDTQRNWSVGTPTRSEPAALRPGMGFGAAVPAEHDTMGSPQELFDLLRIHLFGILYRNYILPQFAYPNFAIFAIIFYWTTLRRRHGKPDVYSK